MRWAVRIGWILLGLLALAGAIHAPLHEDGHSCSPASLCSGLLVLAVGSTLVAWRLFVAPVARLRVVCAQEPLDLRPRLTVRGRAPPRI